MKSNFLKYRSIENRQKKRYKISLDKWKIKIQFF